MTYMVKKKDTDFHRLKKESDRITDNYFTKIHKEDSKHR